VVVTAPRDDASWRGFEARLAAVEPLIPDVPRWTGPAESPADGTLDVVRSASVRRAGSTDRPGRLFRPFRLAAGIVAVAFVAVGFAWFAGSRESGPGTAAELPGWTYWRWVPADGTNLTLDIAADRFVLTDEQTTPLVVALTTSPTGADRLVVYQAAAAMGCAAGSSAEYRWHLDEARITFVETAEPCATRGAVLGRTWVREFPRGTLSAVQAQPGEYRLGWLRPAAGLTLPDNLSITRVLEGPRLPPVLDDYWDMTVGPGVVVITRLDRLPVDVCREAAGDQAIEAASLDDALSALRSVAGLEVGEARTTSVDGFAAFEVDVGVAPDCADGQGRLWSAVPTTLNGEGGDSLVLPGSAVRVRVVQVGDAFVAIAVSPRSDRSSQAPLDAVGNELRPLLDSITFD
jgi:hypothetical protein